MICQSILTHVNLTRFTWVDYIDVLCNVSNAQVKFLHD
jgi:hypothetical protein